MTWDTLTNNGTLAYMNPWTGSAESTNIRLTSGRINTDYGGTNGSWISVANSVIAVPEPSTVMLLFGGSFLVFFGCRRKPPNISGVSTFPLYAPTVASLGARGVVPTGRAVVLAWAPQ